MAPLPILAIVGPTASGKTTLALELAARQGAEIISADSRQVYRELSVGTAKPAGVWEKEGNAAPTYRVSGIPYHLVDIVDPQETFSAARFVEEALAKIHALDERGVPCLLAGGTGFYLKALVEGLAPLPPADASLRRRLQEAAERQGRGALHARLVAVDPRAAAKIPVNNIARVIRALEVFELSGRPLSEWHESHQAAPRPPLAPGRVRFLGIDPGLDALKERIEKRCRRMIEEGMIEETRALLDRGLGEHSPALSALGYPQVAAFLRGEISKDDLLRRLIQDTGRYAKRQRTWFRHQLPVEWKK